MHKKLTLNSVLRKNKYFVPNFVQNYYKVKIIFIHVPIPGQIHPA